MALLAAGPEPVKAQLVDSTQVTPTVPLGTIGKSLAQQVGAGRGDADTPESSIYLIERDPFRAIRRGRQLFQRKFTEAQGVGPRVSPESSGNIHQNAALGAGLADSCAACHGRPKGSAGFGGLVVTRPDSRDAPHLFGLGLQEMLADEMTSRLRAIQDSAVAAAAKRGRAVRRQLRAKGVDFGWITAHPSGELDVSEVRGVNPDLRVRPFFADGREFSVRAFAIGAFNDEMGLQSVDPDMVLAAFQERVTTPSGLVLDGSKDTFKLPPAADPNDDPDGDGVTNEIDVALLDFMEFYLLNYFKPATGRQTTSTRHGRKLMEKIGCTSCHVPNFVIDRDRRVADVDTVFDPNNGKFNRLFATATPQFIVVEDEDDDDENQSYPRLVPAHGSFVVRDIFTDFKRHDLGEAFHERNYDGSMTREFVTEPLWGVGSTPPYGHDGRSINLDEVIRRHGGEAAGVTSRYVALSAEDQDAIIDFLNSLIIFPPEDTASNLNPGGSGHIQDPAGHGTINLGALFQTSGTDE